MRWIDVTVPIRNGMVRWPEHPPVVIKRRLSIDDGNDFNISTVSMSTHTGTHVDAPVHFIRGGKGLDEIPLECLIGPARVIEISDPVSIKPRELEQYNIERGDRVLFKTVNSALLWPEMEFLESYVHLTTESALYLADQGVLTVGVDYLSVAAVGEEAVPTHVALLERDILIIEGLYLADVQQGDYDLICLPLPLEGSDGAPARVILRHID